MGTQAAEAMPLALAAALATAKRKRRTGRENRLAKQHVAPKDKRGRWVGIKLASALSLALAAEAAAVAELVMGAEMDYRGLMTGRK